MVIICFRLPPLTREGLRPKANGAAHGPGETHPPMHSFDPTDAAHAVALASPDARARALPRERCPSSPPRRGGGGHSPARAHPPTPAPSHHRTHGLEPSLMNAAQPHPRRWGASIPTPEPTSRRLRPLTTPPACISRSPPRRPRIALVVCPPSSRPSQTCRPPRRRTVPRAFRHPRRCACGSSLRHCCCSPTAATYFWRARAAWAFEGARARRAAIFGVLGP